MGRTQSGFTLVELMIALAIIGIVASISVVAYKDYVETARLATMNERISGLVAFEQNYFVENSTYFEGSYEPGANGLATIGYTVPSDDDDIVLAVTACTGGSIDRCFKVTATNSQGQTVVWNDGVFSVP